MIKIYNTNMETEKLEEVKEIKKGVWINLVNPSESEIKRVCTEINIEEDFIRYPLDYEEQARIDVEDNMTLFVIDVPIIEDIQDDTSYTTMPLGVIIVGDDFFDRAEGIQLCTIGFERLFHCRYDDFLQSFLFQHFSLGTLT